ncbi:hypothetical protein UFRH5_25 [Pseudomonas phage UF_RH5]|uniref:Uncharacterized protein n=1 Tax=Pseudomonas phage UF_RH1 TaxID=3020045 RepID=A0AAF0B6J6_9CAUD|nr:hypothetical protein P7I00_gp06 [Pseudomonas phage UF_RH1]WCF59032.1 hypothetical protein UFRH1_6 [Pseudomonas phage UF_RH1]WCZ58243.1 hypothetical protein UFRH5_25 [Pseudomonas phage UF_RH5]WOK15224.1 hypothetical protein [Pseudomonas phage UF_RH9]
MQLIQAFNAQQYDPTQGVGSLPIGKHPVIIESSEVKANKANDGGYLQLNLRIIDGPQQGTTGAYRLNLYHSNQQTVEIAHRQLSAICHVIGVFQVTDSSQLHNLPFLIEVGPQKNDPQYTEVKKVFDMNGNEPGKAGAGAPAAQPQQQQPQGQPNGAWGGAPQGQPQQPAGGAAWGGQQQPAQQPAQQPQGAAWGGQPAQNPAPQGGQPAWGGQPAQQPAQQQPAQGGGWQQGGAPAGAAPWSQR